MILLDLDNTLIVSGRVKINSNCTPTPSSTTVYPGAKSLVLYQKEMSAILQTAHRQGIRMGVITAGGAKKEAVLQLLQQEFGLSNLNDDHFIFYNKNNGVVTLDDESKYKTINAIHRQYFGGCFPSSKQCIIFIDDTYKQVQAAKGAGYRAIHAKTGRQTLPTEAADHHITELKKALGLPAASKQQEDQAQTHPPGIAI